MIKTFFYLSQNKKRDKFCKFSLLFLCTLPLFISSFILILTACSQQSQTPTTPDDITIILEETQKLSPENVSAIVTLGVFSFDAYGDYELTEEETQSLLHLMRSTVESGEFIREITEVEDGSQPMFYMQVDETANSEIASFVIESSHPQSIEINSYQYQIDPTALNDLYTSCHMRIFEDMMKTPLFLAQINEDSFTSVSLHSGERTYHMTKAEVTTFANMLQNSFKLFCENRNATYDPDAYKELIIPADDELLATCDITLAGGETISLGIGKQSLIIDGTGYKKGYIDIRDWVINLLG